MPFGWIHFQTPVCIYIFGLAFLRKQSDLSSLLNACFCWSVKKNPNKTVLQHDRWKHTSRGNKWLFCSWRHTGNYYIISFHRFFHLPSVSIRFTLLNYSNTCTLSNNLFRQSRTITNKQPTPDSLPVQQHLPKFIFSSKRRSKNIV